MSIKLVVVVLIVEEVALCAVIILMMMFSVVLNTMLFHFGRNPKNWLILLSNSLLLGRR